MPSCYFPYKLRKTTLNRLFGTKNEIRKSTKAAPLEHIALVLEWKPEIH